MTGRIVVAAFAVLALAAGVFLLERPRAGLEITHLDAGQTPVTVMRQPAAFAAQARAKMSNSESSSQTRTRRCVTGK